MILHVCIGHCCDVTTLVRLSDERCDVVRVAYTHRVAARLWAVHVRNRLLHMMSPGPGFLGRVAWQRCSTNQRVLRPFGAVYVRVGDVVVGGAWGLGEIFWESTDFATSGQRVLGEVAMVWWLARHQRG